jgi:hypothetical protein
MSSPERKTQQEKQEERRQERKAEMERQVRDGSLVIRQMTPAEKKRNPAKERDVKRRK